MGLEKPHRMTQPGQVFDEIVERRVRHVVPIVQTSELEGSSRGSLIHRDPAVMHQMQLAGGAVVSVLVFIEIRIKISRVCDVAAQVPDGVVEEDIKERLKLVGCRESLPPVVGKLVRYELPGTLMEW